MVYFGCKVTKKTVIFQNFLQKNIKISVFIALYVPNAGGNALFIGKKKEVTILLVVGNLWKSYIFNII